jgi:hypothetical protein
VALEFLNAAADRVRRDPEASSGRGKAARTHNINKQRDVVQVKHEGSNALCRGGPPKSYRARLRRADCFGFWTCEIQTNRLFGGCQRA